MALAAEMPSDSLSLPEHYYMHFCQEADSMTKLALSTQTHTFIMIYMQRSFLKVASVPFSSQSKNNYDVAS